MNLKGIFKNKVFSNASWLISINLLRSAAALVITMITARYLGPSNYGLIGYAESIVAFAAPIALLGLANVMVQEFVNYPEREGETLGTALAMSLVSAVVCILGVTVFTMVVNSGEKVTIVVCVLYSVVLVTRSFMLIEYWFQAKLMSKYSAISGFFAYLFVSSYKIYLLIDGKSIYWFAVSNALDHAILAAILTFIYKKSGGLQLSFSLKTAWEMFSKSKHYIVTNMMIAVFAQTDKIMLKLMLDEAATGYYSAATFCAGCTSFLYVAITDSARPSIFASKKISAELFEKRLSQLYSIIIYLSLAQSIVMTIGAPFIIRLMYGADYSPAIPALQLVVWYITFSEIGVVRNIWVLAEEKQNWLWIINLSGAIANVILNYFLIPVWGVMGAAFASLFTQFFSNVVVSYLLKPIRHNTYLMLNGCSIRTLKEMIVSISGG